MIKITHHKGEISIKGHANYAPHGQDIVCAAVSALAQAFIASVEELTPDNLKCDIAEGKAVIRYGNLTENSHTLLNSFFIGLKMIADNYPDYVELTQP